MPGTRIRLDSCGEPDSVLSALALHPRQRLPSAVLGARPPPSSLFWKLVSLRSGRHRLRAFRGVRFADWYGAVSTARRALGSHQERLARWAAAGGPTEETTPGQPAGTVPTHPSGARGRARRPGVGSQRPPRTPAGSLGASADPPGKGTCCRCSQSGAVPSPARGQGRGRPRRRAEEGAGSRRGGLNDAGNHSPAEGEVAQAAARRSARSVPRRRHPPILCQERAERSSPARGRTPGSGAASQPSPPSLPPRLRPPLGAGTHSAPMMSSGGNLPCSETRIIQRSRGERSAGGGGGRAFRRTHNPPARVTGVRAGMRRAPQKGGSEGV